MAATRHGTAMTTHANSWPILAFGPAIQPGPIGMRRQFCRYWPNRCGSPWYRAAGRGYFVPEWIKHELATPVIEKHRWRRSVSRRSSIPCVTWCYIGKKRLEKALVREKLDHMPITWRPFLLNPDMPTGGIDRKLYLSAKFGGTESATRCLQGD